MEDTKTTAESSDEVLLKEIRDRYRYYSDAWREQREHRQKLMRYLCGDPWDEEDRKARKDAGRPCISHDELNQYVFQCVNAARQNKRGIKIEPAGNGANDKTAALRQDLARTIEYKSKATSIYLRAYQDEVEGAYGFARVSRRYINDDTDDQEIVIRPIQNPDSVLYDPDCKEDDWADARGVFILDPIPTSDFKTLYPDADLIGFTDDDGRIKQDWIHENTVLLCEYWKLVTTRVKGKTGRMVDKKSIVQYITNGVEILETNPQMGKEIPIVPFIGLQRYIDDGNGPKRKLFALASFALDPQMTLAYLSTLEMEEAGLTPKVPYKGYVGQFETDAEAWTDVTKVPRGFIQVDPIVDGANGQVLPLPVREQFTPNFAAYEVAKESARRAIQAAIGASPLPTDAQRQNQKSGVALDKIQRSQDIGSFHFVDGFERAIERIGRIVDAWIPETYDTEREMGLHKADESRRIVTLNAAQPDANGETNTIGDEQHDVTVGAGPSAASTESAAQEFLDLLVTELGSLPIDPPAKAKILSLAIQQKKLGAKGDEMAEIISPTNQQEMPPAAQQAIGQAKQEVQAVHAYAQQLEGKIKTLEMEKQAKVIDNAGRMDIERLKGEIDIAKAEIATKAQSAEERLQFLEDAWKQLHSQAHEVGLQASNQAHTADMADQAHQQQQEIAAQQPAQDQQ